MSVAQTMIVLLANSFAATPTWTMNHVPPEEAQIAGLVEQLGHVRYAQRQEAFRNLVGFGPEAEFHLRQAENHPHLETRRSIERLLILLEGSEAYRLAVRQMTGDFVSVFRKTDLSRLKLDSWHLYAHHLGDTEQTRKAFVEMRLLMDPAPMRLWKRHRFLNGEPGSEEYFRTLLCDWFEMTFVSDLPWELATVGASGHEVRRDRSHRDSTMVIGNRKYFKGISTHSFNDNTPADIQLDISDKGFSLFAAEVGCDESGNGSMQFQVWADGKLRDQSPVLRGGERYAFHVDVTGARRIILRVTNGGDSYSGDHAVWGWARFLPARAGR